MSELYGEGRPTGETVKLSPAEEQARKRRGQWLALALVAFVFLVFSITVARLGGSLENATESRAWPSGSEQSAPIISDAPPSEEPSE
ncbi:MAG: hypothetical protein AAGB25_06480 [Pseudomonadota bacterium]